MEDLIIPPNMEALVSRFLRSQPEVADIVDDRTYTALPADADFPAIRVIQLNDTKVTRQPLWVVAYNIQIECWGGRKIEAWRGAATAMAALDQRLEGEVDDAVITGVDIGPLMDIPDDDYEPARPRYLFTSTITAHPAATIATS